MQVVFTPVISVETTSAAIQSTVAKGLFLLVHPVGIATLATGRANFARAENLPHTSATKHT